MKKKIRRIITVVLAAVLAVSAGMMIYKNVQYKEGADTYDEAVTLAGVPDLTAAADAAAQEPEQSDTQEQTTYVDPYADLLSNMDFTALRKVNGDVLGWILIPDTRISYPIVKTDDNNYYLTHDYKKDYSAVGAIFMEQGCSHDFSDFNTIVYGHRMNNGSMFAGLKYYKSSSYCKSHPYVYVTTDAGCSKYEIFAAYEISTAGDTYKLGMKSESTKQAYIDYCVGSSLYQTGVTPTTDDHILTLSTCTGNGHATRWIVQAVLKSAVKSDAAQAAGGGAAAGGGSADTQTSAADTQTSAADTAETSGAADTAGGEEENAVQSASGESASASSAAG